MALCWGSEPPAFSIRYERPLGPADSGFSVLFADAPDPDDLPPPSPEGLPPGIVAHADERPAVPRQDDDAAGAEDGVDGAPLEAELEERAA